PEPTGGTPTPTPPGPPPPPPPPITYTLIMVADPGAGGTAIDVTAAGPYTAGTVVSISAVASGDYVFDGWTAVPAVTFGDANAEVTTFTMPAQNITVTANFVVEEEVPETYVLTMAVDGTGSGTVSPTEGDHTYNYGDKVNIKAKAGTDSDFTNWLQNENIDNTTTANTKVTMNGDQTVTAIFTKEKTCTLTMTVDGTGSGTVSPTEGDHTYKCDRLQLD
ncbi:unnamed protein product, partial [marine sediment metagenome]